LITLLLLAALLVLTLLVLTLIVLTHDVFSVEVAVKYQHGCEAVVPPYVF
jgi:hypothetical protein